MICNKIRGKISLLCNKIRADFYLVCNKINHGGAKNWVTEHEHEVSGRA